MPPKVLKKFEKDLHRPENAGFMHEQAPPIDVMYWQDMSWFIFRGSKFIFTSPYG
jgi:hypothetical protein